MQCMELLLYVIGKFQHTLSGNVGRQAGDERLHYYRGLGKSIELFSKRAKKGVSYDCSLSLSQIAESLESS